MNIFILFGTRSVFLYCYHVSQQVISMMWTFYFLLYKRYIVQQFIKIIIFISRLLRCVIWYILIHRDTIHTSYKTKDVKGNWNQFVFDEKGFFIVLFFRFKTHRASNCCVKLNIISVQNLGLFRRNGLKVKRINYFKGKQRTRCQNCTPRSNHWSNA